MSTCSLQSHHLYAPPTFPSFDLLVFSRITLYLASVALRAPKPTAVCSCQPSAPSEGRTLVLPCINQHFGSVVHKRCRADSRSSPFNNWVTCPCHAQNILCLSTPPCSCMNRPNSAMDDSITAEGYLYVSASCLRPGMSMPFNLR